MSTRSVTLFSLTIAVFLLSTFVVYSDGATCELIKLPMCYGMPWNKTRMPNHLHHSTQENAKLAIEQFQGLVNTNCSSHLIFFLCAMYAPICAYGFQDDAGIPPCKSLCMHAKAGCEPVMMRYKVKWPDYLSCDDFPEYDRGVCISPEAIVDEMPRPPTLDRHNNNNSGPEVVPPIPDVVPPKQEPPPKPQVCDDCIGPPKANIRVFLEKQYEYAIRANVTGLEYPPSQNGQTWTVVNVMDVLHFQDISIPKDEVILWTHDECVCPEVVPGKVYLIMCFQHMANGHLMLRDDCIVEEWNNEWPALVKKWYKRLKKSQRQESTTDKKPKNKNKRRRGRKRGTATPTPQSNSRRRE